MAYQRNSRPGANFNFGAPIFPKNIGKRGGGGGAGGEGD